MGVILKGKMQNRRTTIQLYHVYTCQKIRFADASNFAMTTEVKAVEEKSMVITKNSVNLILSRERNAYHVRLR